VGNAQVPFKVASISDTIYRDDIIGTECPILRGNIHSNRIYRVSKMWDPVPPLPSGNQRNQLSISELMIEIGLFVRLRVTITLCTAMLRSVTIVTALGVLGNFRLAG